jgi:hypothetical protein
METPLERAERQRARRWGVAVLVILLAVTALTFHHSTDDGRDTRHMDRGIARLADGLASGQRSDFIAAQKVFLDINSGWIVDQYAAFAIQATERLRRRVVGPDDGESVTEDATSEFYVLIADGEVERAREWALAADRKRGAGSRSRSEYMLRFVSDLQRVGGEDIVERIRGR